MKIPVLAALLAAAPAAVAAPPAVTAKQTASTIVLDNGLVALTFSRQDGQVHSIKRRDGAGWKELGAGAESMYWDSNSEPADPPSGGKAPKKGYSRFAPLRSVELTANTPQRAEVVVKGGPGPWLKFEAEAHWVLFTGDSGFYSYVIIRHPADQPKATFWQTRFVIKTASGDLFTTQVVSDDHVRAKPKSGVVKKLMDATYLLEDGSINTKYSNSVTWAETPVYGQAGPRFGLWSVSASSEYYNGAPIKQGQTTHDNVLLRVLQSVHFGAAPVIVEKGEEWSKIYGPFFTYVNTGSSVAQLWEDAKARQRAEATKWPYPWVDAPEYARARGTLTGQWRLSAGAARQGALAVLAEPGGDWARQGKRYIFFTRTGPDGKFAIPKIAPGKYTLYLSGADQPEEFRRDGIEIKAGQTTDLGVVAWPATPRDRTLWQLGTFDRRAGEFRNGDDARNFEMFRRYPEQFPRDVDFTVGRSDPRRDWNYAQWTWFSRTPEWKLRFELPSPPAGPGTLIIGIAAAQPLHGQTTDLRVKLNGREIGVIALEKTGTSGYRGGVQDTKYNVLRFPIPAALWKPGENVLTFAHGDAEPFPKTDRDVGFNVGHVMYDAIRLDVEPEGTQVKR